MKPDMVRSAGTNSPSASGYLPEAMYEPAEDLGYRSSCPGAHHLWVCRCQFLASSCDHWPHTKTTSSLSALGRKRPILIRRPLVLVEVCQPEYPSDQATRRLLVLSAGSVSQTAKPIRRKQINWGFWMASWYSVFVQTLTFRTL